MKHLFFALFSLIFLAGCGKKKETEPQGQTKALAKPAAPVSKQEPPKTSPKYTPKPEAKATDKKPGTILWKFFAGDAVRSAPAIGGDGTVYVGSANRNVYALDGRTGVKKWEITLLDRVYSSPAIGFDGTVYVGSANSKAYALDGKTGAKK